MAGFRLTNGSAGCPPEEEPPANYENPFRLDSADRLWLNGKFNTNNYVGAARHDIGDIILGSNDAPLNSDIATRGMQPLTITNNSAFTLHYLMAYDLDVELATKGTNFVLVGIQGFWAVQAGTTAKPRIWASGIRTGSTDYIRIKTVNSANPFDTAIEADPNAPSSMVLAPGETAIVTARLSSQYSEGTPTGTEHCVAYGVVRMYSYIPHA